MVKRLDRKGWMDCMGYGKWILDGNGFTVIGCSVVSLSFVSSEFIYCKFNLSLLCIRLGDCHCGDSSRCGDRTDAGN